MHDLSAEQHLIIDTAKAFTADRLRPNAERYDQERTLDREALEARKANKPADTAIDMAAAMGIDLLTEEQYRTLQELGNFDL